MRPFHLAFPVNDIQEAKRFYIDVLGCSIGREAPSWVDFDFFGHQISAHLGPDETKRASANAVDGKQVPVRHFGMILSMDEWQQMADRLKSAKVKFIIEPYTRFKGQIGEQTTMFILDPSGNALEFKAFKDDSMIFAH